MTRISILAIAIIALLMGVAVAQDEVSNLSFVVVRDYSGKPVRNASVVLHPVDEHGKQSRGGYELKADADGKAKYDGVPYGKLRIQVLAQGFQTYGEDYQINQPTMEIAIRLKRPQGQYSIYESHPEEKKSEEKKEDGGQQKPDAGAKPQQ